MHLSAVHAAWTERRRLVELRALLNVIAAHQDGFHVLAGDFNTLAPGEDLDVARLPIAAADVVREADAVSVSDHVPVVADLTIP